MGEGGNGMTVPCFTSMDLHGLLSNAVFALPLRRGNASLIRTVGDRFAAYRDLIGHLHNSSDFTDTIIRSIPDIEHLCDRLIRTYKQYLGGSPSKAYFEFDDGMSCLKDLLLFYVQERVKYLDSISLFRMRRESCKELSLGDIFHIPFESRGRVGNQRFSIDGFPCLYLGSSVYVCWEELGRPPFADIFVSRFQLLTKRPNILDLTFSVNEARHVIERFKKDDPWHEWSLYRVVDKIVLFPLIACCSIVSNDSSHVFEETYIIPQLLLEWVRNNSKHINGIEYSSLSLRDYNLEHSLYKNYVFPVRHQKASGHCRSLSGLFEFTEPISWDFALTLCGQPEACESGVGRDFRLMRQRGSYRETQFGQIEEFLGSLPFRRLARRKD
jgi:hypothetical protein